MKSKTALLGALAFLAAAPGFSAIPASIWKTDDTTFQDMWNKTTLDTATTFWPASTNWVVANPGTDSAMITTDGLARQGTTQNWTNLVWKWQTDSSQKNFEIRFTWRQLVTPSGNSGFNIRGFCSAGTLANLCNGLSGGFKVSGPQIDLGPSYTGDIWNSAGGGTTGTNLGPTAPTSCAVSTATFQDLAMRVVNDTMFTYYYPNGFAAGNPTSCTRYTFTLPNYLAATSPGLMALQYETLEINQFKNIKIRNLDAVQAVSINGVRQLSPSLYSIRTGARSLRVGVSAAGSYSVEIADLSGRILHKVKGHGSSAHHEIPLAQAGIYIVKISSSSRGTALRKVVVR